MPKLEAGQVVCYKSREYRVIWSGKTKYGERVHLAFLNGGKDFWVDPALVSDARCDSKPAKKSKRIERPYACDECGDYVQPGSKCWETGLEH